MTPVATAETDRSADHQGCRGISVPSRRSPISISITRGKPIRPEKNRIWNEVKVSPNSFTTTSWVA